MTATAVPTLSRKEPPDPLVRLNRPVWWVWNKLQLIAWAFVFTVAGVAMAAAVYYLITQVNDTANHLWHTAVSKDSLRHDIRDIGEGLMGGLLGQQVVWNAYKKRRALNRVDRFEIERLKIANPKDTRRLSIKQLLLSPFWVLVYAIPGFLLAQIIIAILDPQQTFAHLEVPANASLWELVSAKSQNLLRDNWPHKLMGYASAFAFGRRPAKGVFHDLQLWFVERRVLLDTGGFRRDRQTWWSPPVDAIYRFVDKLSPTRRIPLWFYPPTYQARYNDVRERYESDPLVIPQEAHGPAHSFLIAGGSLVAASLAFYGAYILIFIAP